MMEEGQPKAAKWRVVCEKGERIEITHLRDDRCEKYNVSEEMVIWRDNERKLRRE